MTIDLSGMELAEERQGLRLELSESPLKGMTIEKGEEEPEEDKYAEFERNRSLS